MRCSRSMMGLHRPTQPCRADSHEPYILEWFQTPPAPAAPLLMPPEITKEDVPVGTEVWLTDA
jgi:hypothetical protein